jgi:hypothetical protein
METRKKGEIQYVKLRYKENILEAVLYFSKKKD